LLVHGRAQQGKDPRKLKAEWIEALNRGAAKSGASLAPRVDVAFPFYGDLLDNYAKQADIPLTSDIQARGEQNDDFLRFQYQFAESIRVAKGISQDEVNQEFEGQPGERGPLNWRWVQATLRVIDRKSREANQAALESFTRDVYLYLTSPLVRADVDAEVTKLLTEEPTVVVGHSLGTVVSYNVLRTDKRRLNVPLYVTVGCPLAVRAVRDRLTPVPTVEYPARISRWFNAYDARDVVALYPLDAANFDVTPAIENKGDVDNSTDNRHGISGYLDDKVVAQKIVSSLRG
jgi:hypothetical protein